MSYICDVIPLIDGITDTRDTASVVGEGGVDEEEEEEEEGEEDTEG